MLFKHRLTFLFSFQVLNESLRGAQMKTCLYKSPFPIFILEIQILWHL